MSQIFGDAMRSEGKIGIDGSRHSLWNCVWEASDMGGEEVERRRRVKQRRTIRDSDSRGEANAARRQLSCPGEGSMHIQSLRKREAAKY
ncbi:hypothetical protein MRB53_042032 [Persea americana]|nr:hypothetical protein MRB53_042032 [Persea americana]